MKKLTIGILTICLVLSFVVMASAEVCHIEDGTTVFFKQPPDLLAESLVIGKTKAVIIRELSDAEAKHLGVIMGVDFTGSKVLHVENVTITCRFHGSHTYPTMKIIVMKKDLICN